jgi:NAD(P)-dependent dehydrogenase (short-subunit alcohol dehydrogenase family)
VDLRTVEMDVSDQASVDAAIATIIDEAGRIDVVVHNAGHMTLGPVEAFTPEEIAAVYDTNVLSTQRVNRAVLPHLREQRDGLLIWVGSSSARGGTPPYLAPYFAAKAAEDSLAVSYAAELARFGIETTIIVPGSYTTGTNHFAHACHAADQDASTGASGWRTSSVRRPPPDTFSHEVTDGTRWGNDLPPSEWRVRPWGWTRSASE